MDLATFRARLKTATQWAIEAARAGVRQALPDEVVFVIFPNQSYDGNPRVGDEVCYPDDSLPQHYYHGPCAPEDVLNFLWRDGKVPEWVNLMAVQVAEGCTWIELRCCGRFTAQDDLLYHNDPGGVAPCGVHFPLPPEGWESEEVSGRFDLVWRRHDVEQLRRWTGAPQ